VTS
jgi:hypothetical protein